MGGGRNLGLTFPGYEPNALRKPNTTNALSKAQRSEEAQRWSETLKNSSLAYSPAEGPQKPNFDKKKTK